MTYEFVAFCALIAIIAYGGWCVYTDRDDWP